MGPAWAITFQSAPRTTHKGTLSLLPIFLSFFLTCKSRAVDGFVQRLSFLDTRRRDSHRSSLHFRAAMLGLGNMEKREKWEREIDGGSLFKYGSGGPHVAYYSGPTEARYVVRVCVIRSSV